MIDSMIRVERLTKIYDGKKRVLDDVSFSVECGEFVTIHGKSGCGKTTLLNIIGGMDRPTSGRVIIDGQETTDFNEDELARFRLAKIGFVFQDYNLLMDMTIRQNIALPLVLSKTKDRGRLDEVLKRFDISHIAEEGANKVSGGEAQRAAIARAMMNNPKIILADEPTGNLDEENTTKVIDAFKIASVEFKTTILLATHDKELAKNSTTRIHLRDAHAIVEGRQENERS